MLINNKDNQEQTPEELTQEELKSLRRDFVFHIYSAKNTILKCREQHPELLDLITTEFLQNSVETKDLSSGQLLVRLFDNLERKAFELIEDK